LWDTRYSQDSREKISDFYGTEDTIYMQLLMQTEVLSLYLEGDAIISDSLNHASIIDGVRLCKAARYRYANCDMEDLEQLIKANEAGSRFKIIVTDGVSLDGVVAPLDKICDCG
jgi:glycine C-acetyltransferase